MPQAVKVRSDIEVSCYSYEGIDAVKNALKMGLKLSTEEFPVNVRNTSFIKLLWYPFCAFYICLFQCS